MSVTILSGVVWLLGLAVAVGSDGSPVCVSWSGDAQRNVIVWMDHRATDQAERINASRSPVLQFVGGGISPEMEAPKVPFWSGVSHISSVRMLFVFPQKPAHEFAFLANPLRAVALSN